MAVEKKEREHVLPHNLDAERSVLGAVLVDPEAFAVAAGALGDGRVFFRDAHQKVYEVLAHLHSQRKPMDLVLLRDELERRGWMDDVGGPAYVAALIDGVPMAVNVAYYAGIVREKARLRGLIDAAAKTSQRAYEQDDDAVAIAEAGARMMKAAVGPPPSAPVGEDGAIGAFVKSIDEGTGQPVLTGYTDYDALVDGWRPGEFVVVAARPGVGKSSWCLGAARNIALSGKPAAFFPLEMSVEELGSRMLAWRTGVPSRRFERGEATPHEYALVTQAMEAPPIPLSIVSWARSVTEIVAWCERAKQEQGLVVAVVDYLQMATPVRSRESREAEVAGISKAFAQMAKDLKIVVVAVSALSRAPEARKDKRPQMSDLRESGALESDANQILLVFREELHKAEPANAGIAEVIVAKNRGGPTGVVKLQFEKELAMFRDLAQV